MVLIERAGRGDAPDCLCLLLPQRLEALGHRCRGKRAGFGKWSGFWNKALEAGVEKYAAAFPGTAWS